MAPRIEKEAIHAFAAEVARELGVTVDPHYSEHHWAFALNLESDVLLFAAIEKGKATYSVIVSGTKDGQAARLAFEAGASVDRGAKAAADTIRNRLLPGVADAIEAAREKFKAEAEARARVVKKRDQLAKRYPELKLSVDDRDDTRIQVSTKYGGGVHLSGYIRENETPSAYVWGLLADSGRGFSMTNIDTPAGRAFLKMCNAG